MTESNRSDYRYFVPISTRWMDNDVYGHVNNVTYYSYFDTAANDYLIHAGDLDFTAGDVIGFVVASSCQYKSPIAFPDKLDIGLRVNKLGNRSVEYGLAVFKQGQDSCAAYGTFTHVFVNRHTHKAVAIPASLRVALDQIQISDSLK